MLQEIPFEVLRWVFSWISEEEQAMINQVSKDFQFVVDEEKFEIGISIAVSSIHLLQWSVRNGLPLTDKITRSSIVNGKLEVLRFLINILKVPIEKYSCRWAARSGQLEVLRALRSGELGKVYPWSETTCGWAANGGHLEVLRALRSGELGGVCPWNQWVCSWAADSGHLAILRALRSGELGEICPWNEWTCSYATYKGHLEILRALRSGELGGVCPWNKNNCIVYSRRHQLVQDAILRGEFD